MGRRAGTDRGAELGFTLVELLVVIVVLGVLAGITVFGVARFRSDGDAARCAADVRTVNSAADAYLAATGSYPRSTDELATGGYLKTAPATGTYAFDPVARTATRDPACGAVPTPGTTPPTAAPTTAAEKEVAMTAADWKVVSGKATITGSTVDISIPNENRVGSVRPRTSGDVVFTTTATLRAGAGYGLWTRATLQSAAGVSGYVFQYDLPYGNAFVLRQWAEGKECSVPLKVAKMSTAAELYAPHKVVVVTAGDTLRATVDGTVVLDLPGVAAAVAASSCKFPPATGTEVGFRAWGAGTSAVFVDTTLG